MIKKVLFTFLIVFSSIGIVQAQDDIQIEGNGTIIVDGQTSISTTDDTDFGQTPIGTPVVHQFTIRNTGSATLYIELPPAINDLGTGTSDFSTTEPSFSVPASGTSTFDVTFNPSVSGIQSVEIAITSSDDDESPYTFNIQGEATPLVLQPDIELVGNSTIIVDGQTTISTVDDTDFGQTQLNVAVVHQFTIRNTGSATLYIELPPAINDLGTGTSDFSTTSPAFQVVSGGTTTFDVTFNPSVSGIQTVEMSVTSNDPDERPFTYNIQGEGILPPVEPIIEVYGAGDELTGVLIANGDYSPDVLDDTDFGIILNNTPKTNTYTIFNNGTSDLDITSIYVILDTEFQLDNNPAPITLAPGTSTNFNIVFLPAVTGTYSGLVQINHSGTNESSPYQFSIVGESSDVVIGGDILITQYYEGGGDNQWIEIKNISGTTINAGEYFLCLYDDSQLPIITQIPPLENVAIPAMVADQVILFQNPLASLPTGNIGVTPEPDDNNVCSFTGNDVILISRTIDGTCYGNRQDIIGNPDGNRWGEGTSFVRGGCASETPDINFVESNWINLESTVIVDGADINSNISLGTQFIGTTSWTGASWDNGIADRTRNAVISSPYSVSNGTIVACSLTVDTSLDFDGDTEESVILYGDLTINAPFIIGDKESLVTYNPNANISGNITKIENSTPLLNIHDNTYWSSPIVNANIGTVFTGVDPNRIFYIDGNRTDYIFSPPYNHWYLASGSMQVGRGYAVEGASTDIQTVSFTGIPNNGDIPISVYYKGIDDLGDENDNFNLLGNPYPSALDLDSFLSDPQHNNVEGTIYLWSHATEISGGNQGEFVTEDYATYTAGSGGVAAGPDGEIPLGYLASSQGFMIRTIGHQNSVNFENDDVVPGQNSQFFKQNISKKQVTNKDDRDRVWLNLTTENGGFSQILVGFFEDATNGKDRMFDGLKLKAGNPITFYSLIESGKYAIQGLSSFTSDKIVALGFDTEIAKSFTIGIDEIEGALKDADIYLVDNLLGITHNLKDSDYQFEQTITGEFPDRFTLQFAGAALGIDSFEKDNDFSIANTVDGFNIHASKVVTNIKVYDMLGRMLVQTNPNKQSFNLKVDNIKAGTVLVIESTLDNGAILSKKAIKY